MQSRILHDHEGLRTFALVFEIGDEPLSGITDFARENDVSGATLTAIGAFEEVVLQYWNWDTKKYEDHPVREQCEVASLVGNVSLTPDGDVKVHAHLVVGLRDGTARAGHLKEGVVRPTLEVVLTETPEHLQRVHDDETGLALIRFGGAARREERSRTA